MYLLIFYDKLPDVMNNNNGFSLSGCRGYWILNRECFVDLMIGFVMSYVCCAYMHVRLVMSSHLLFCCIYTDAWCCCPKTRRDS